jgi:hypothetical protein
LNFRSGNVMSPLIIIFLIDFDSGVGKNGAKR